MSSCLPRHPSWISGSIRLRGLSHPEHIYQLLHPDLPAEFPPLVSQDKVPNNLPQQLTSFIGRKKEIEEVKQLLAPNLADDQLEENAALTRLITLIGPGGTGKTRLSLQAGGELLEVFPDGVWLVELAPLADPQFIVQTIAARLGLSAQPGRPLLDHLTGYLRSRRLLLILDNCEHLLADCAALADSLLRDCPNLHILTSSREALGIDGEQAYHVRSLALPQHMEGLSLAQLSSYEAVSLFVQRAAAVQTGFTLTSENAASVLQICRRLDGIPLAIELAAARTRVLMPAQIALRLDQRFQLLTGGSRTALPRQRTLQALIDWSFDLLSEPESIFFQRLSVFVGGRTLEAAESVAGYAPIESFEVLDLLQQLVSKSLVVAERTDLGMRYHFLRTIRQYAQNKLAQSGEASIMRSRHLEYFVSLVEEMAPGYRRQNQLSLLARTDFEIDNMRAALDWAVESGRHEAAARLVSAAVDYLYYYGSRFVEGYQWALRVLKNLEKISPEFQIRLLVAAGKLAYANGDLSSSKQYCQEALKKARKLGDKENQAWSLIFAGVSSIKQSGTDSEAVRYVAEGLTIFRELDHQPGIAQALNIMGELLRSSGDYRRAREAYEESLDIVRETGEVIRENILIANLSYVAYNLGDYERAAELSASSFNQAYRLGMRLGAANRLADLAGPLSKLGEAEKAAQLMGLSAALMAETGADYQIPDKNELTKYEADIRAQLDEQTFDAAWKKGQAMDLDQAVSLTLGE